MIYSSLAGFVLLVTSVTIYLLCIRCDCDLLSIAKLKEIIQSNRNIGGVDGDRDRNFSGKYNYNPIIEMDENVRLEKFTFNADGDESDVESDF